MKIVPYSDKYLDSVVSLFIEVYSDKDGTWSIKKAQEYIQRSSSISPGFCFVADENGKHIGSVFSYLYPFYDKDLVFIDTLQVNSAHRHKGVATQLLKTVMEKAQRENIPAINMWVDSSKAFPLTWYQSMGFKENGWRELSLSLVT